MLKHLEKVVILDEPHQNRIDDTVIDMLKNELNTKNMQIESQQKIIVEQSQSIQDLTSALSRQQTLHAGTIQQQLLEQTQEENTEISEEKEKKPSLFDRIFGKK